MSMSAGVGMMSTVGGPVMTKNYSSLFVKIHIRETLHRDMCIACSGSSSGFKGSLRTMPIHKIVSKERCHLIS